MSDSADDLRVERDWWRTAVVYEVYLRSFADGSGDGIGDIAGLRSRLGYLVSLGVDAIWITPWYASPMADGGYDVADHRAIAPEFGTLADAETLIVEAHRHGLRVLLDLVPNHTSDQHPWFQAALAAAPETPERDRYWFRPGTGPDGDRPPNDWRSTQGGPAWTRAGEQWYLHLFSTHQPDLNWCSPEVRADVDATLRFWFDRGVDGFRIDVAHGLEKDPNLPNLNHLDGSADVAGDELLGVGVVNHPHWDRDAAQDHFRRWRAIADAYTAATGRPRVFVAEAWRIRPGGLHRYLQPCLLHTAFNFDYLGTPWNAAAFSSAITGHLEELSRVGAPATWVLSTHDLTRHVTRYIPVAATKENGRAVGLRRARAAALLTLALPGSAYLYQGEELGLEDVEDLPEAALRDPIWHQSGHQNRGRDGRRVPLPWTTSGPSLGFSSAEPWLPQPSHWAQLAADQQDRDPHSTLALYRAAIDWRRQAADLQTGAFSLEAVGHDGEMLAFHRGERFSCLTNFGNRPVPIPDNCTVLLASSPDVGHDVPTDTTVWLEHP